MKRYPRNAMVLRKEVQKGQGAVRRRGRHQGIDDSKSCAHGDKRKLARDS